MEVYFPLRSLKTHMDRIQPLSNITGVYKLKGLGFGFPLTLIKQVKYKWEIIALWVQEDFYKKNFLGYKIFKYLRGVVAQWLECGIAG